MREISKYCEDCVHNEVCRYEAYCPTEHCNDKDVAEDYTPTGKWIRTGQKNVYGGVVIKCSHCGTTLITSPERYEVAENYCDMCGAKMEKNNEK